MLPDTDCISLAPHVCSACFLILILCHIAKKNLAISSRGQMIGKKATPGPGN